ncbi:MAG: PaaI family thioesterase [Jatrophihabitans sp.]|uniref:PaaI family thioesterase n=1 Tax=Jatrophihabitans sp. TaxID=1932789 RepID=UPI003F81084B
MSDERVPLHPWPEPERPWVNRDPGLRGGVEYADLHLAQRLVQSRLAGAAPPPDVMKDVTERLAEVAELLAAHQVPEADRYDGWRPDLPGRGLPALPAYVIDDETEHRVAGRVTFSRFYLGGNGAVHGGAHSLLFDDVLGRVMNHHHRGVSRTAYLKVNYRRITPIEVELTFEAVLDRVEGRKRFGAARLFDPSGAVVADADALFLELLPGQQ